MKTVIMQPTYLPWMGYFDLIDQSDVFVILDDVQFTRQSWQQRNKIRTHQGWQWLTVPIIHKFPQLIKDVEINNTVNWNRTHWRTIMHNYQKADSFLYYRAKLEAAYNTRWENLSELNIFLIKLLGSLMGIKMNCVLSSNLGVEGEKVERLIKICKKVNADVYLSPLGSAEYIEEDNRFLDENIKLEYHNFGFPIYRQLYGEFISYLSVIDLLFNEGNRSLKIIRDGRNENSSA